MRFSTIDPVAAAEYIARRLYRPLRFADAEYQAVAETEYPFGGDDWFWTDDNAKILELLARPEICARYRREAEETLRFLRIMCRGPFILRRVSTPRLLLTEQNGSETSYYHSLMHLRCDLPRGVMMAGIRFHDNRTADNLLLHTNCVEFTYRKQKYSVPIEEAIDDTNTVLDGHRLELRFAAELFFMPRRTRMRIGRVTYVYLVDSRSMAINVEATLDVDPGAEIDDVVLTIGHDHLSHGTNNVNYHGIVARLPNGETARVNADAPGRYFLPAAGIGYYSIVQNEIAGFALAVHSAPREPQCLAEIEVLVREPGKLHFVRSRYRFDGACRGRRLVIAEDKMLTAGGFYGRADDCSRLLRDAVALRSTSETAIDFSVSYDYGAELNALAQHFAVASPAGDGSGSSGDVKSLFDLYMGHYVDLFVEGHFRRENTIFSRQLAFVILALVTMYRATGSSGYQTRLVQLCDVLLEFEKRFDDIAGMPVSGFTMGVHNNRTVYVDCHSAALLALIEAAAYVADARLAEAIDRALGCYAIRTTTIEWLGIPRKIDVVAVDWTDDDGVRQSNHGFWNYHTGLTLRAFAALRRSTDPALQAVAARHRERIALFEMIMRWHIEQSLTWHDGAVEIRSSILSTETNSETQPWAALGLLDQAAGQT
ncbi:MAG TPA: hypothetical protein VHW90_02825 [Stellaceae bacterium]|jgi:hypothetical protein|nr:hypothetical protein [Stellaceae bacterium]